MTRYVLPLLVVLLYAGCTKPDLHPPIDCTCKLLSMVDTVTKFTFDYRYDAKNRLEYRTSTYGGHAAPDFKVIYDAKGRVSQYIFKDYGNYQVGDMFFEWHYVYYDNRNNIVRDTVYYEGTIGANGPVWDEGIPPESMRYTITYQYDQQNRMTGLTDMFTTRTFTYNADGNLTTNEYGDVLTYDNKVNWARTDPFLQFIYHDYSRNNPVGATSYNKYGLPLEYPYLGEGQWQLTYSGLGFLNPRFNYTCKP